MPTITPGHGPNAKFASTDDNLSLVTKKPNLGLMRSALEAAQSDAHWFFQRNTTAFNQWHARWDGQTLDGKKWGTNETDPIFPWIGASDTRVRTTEMIIAEHVTVAMFALSNMKVQAKSNRPVVSMRESQQATILLNWMIFTHMAGEVHRELPLAMNWRNGYGTAIIGVDWEQERRLEYQPISLMTLQAFAQQSGDTTRLDQFMAALFDPAQEDGLVEMIQGMSPIVTTAQARKIVKDLRELSASEIPIPYVFKSKPRWTALRPMVDVIFPAGTDDLQRARWIDRVEWVTQTELEDRIETAGYSADFVDSALDHKGQQTNEMWANRTMIERQAFGRFGGRYDFDDKIELHHFYAKVLDRGVPVLYCTVFHADVEEAAKHEPYEYQHGQYPFHALRREYHERPILSSRGIAEIAYTWEQEIKEQRDARTDRTALALRPVMFANYKDVLKIKQTYMPGTIFPTTRGNEPNFAPPPGFDQGSIEIEASVMATVDRFFGLFGAEVDPALKQMRTQQLADATLGELAPVIQQTFQLMQQYLPDAEVAKVVGTLSRPFHVEREEIQGAYEIMATCDMREQDPAFLKEKLGYLAQLAQMDSLGLLDKAKMLKLGAEAIDYNAADELVIDQQPASNKEIQDEINAVSSIIGSGIEQPMPMGANYGLRLQTMQNTLQGSQPAQKKLQQDQETAKVLQNRMLFFQRQIQQQKNAQVGKMQVQSADGSGSAPMVAEQGQGQ